MKRSTPMKRTPMKRKAPLRATPTEARATVKVSKAKCVVCRTPFTRFDMRVKWCSPECGAEHATKRLAEQKAKAARQEAKAHREAKADSKPLAHWLALTEAAVNAVVRLRDHGQPCISCGTARTVQWQAGHYLSVGAHPELRYDLRNIHLQCHRCNVALSGNQAKYRIGLLAKEGPEVVDWLEGPHPIAKYTREALAEIRKEANAMARQIKKEKGL